MSAKKPQQPMLKDVIKSSLLYQILEDCGPLKQGDLVRMYPAGWNKKKHEPLLGLQTMNRSCEVPEKVWSRMRVPCRFYSDHYLSELNEVTLRKEWIEKRLKEGGYEL